MASAIKDFVGSNFMNIKKISLVIAVFFVVITLSACGKKSLIENYTENRWGEEKTETVKSKPEKIKIKGVLAGRLVDQNGNSFKIPYNERLYYEITDSLGDRASGGSVGKMGLFDSSKNATEYIKDRLEQGQKYNGILKKDGLYLVDSTLKPGDYKIRFYPDDRDFIHYYPPAEMEFKMKKKGVWLGDIEIKRMATIDIKIVNKLGNDLAASRRVSEVQLEDEKYGTIKDFNKTYNDRYYNTFGRRGGFNGTDILYWPPGEYTVTFSADGYEPIVKEYTVKDEDIEETIVFEKKLESNN